MLRQTLGLAGILLLAAPAATAAQGVPRPAQSRLWVAPARAAADTTHRGGGSMSGAGAIFGGLMGVAFGIGRCSGDNQCNKGVGALIGGAMGAAIGLGLGSLLQSL